MEGTDKPMKLTKRGDLVFYGPPGRNLDRSTVQFQNVETLQVFEADNIYSGISSNSAGEGVDDESEQPAESRGRDPGQGVRGEAP